MDCRTTRLLFSDARHGRLAPDEREQRQTHLRDCEACSQAERDEAALTQALRERLPRHPASRALKKELEARWLGSRGPRPWLRSLLATAGVAAALTLALAFGFAVGRRHGDPVATLGTEAVNDHLRMLEGEAPLQVLTSDLHQVKPWFAGKLDFAPPIAFRGDADYPLLGGEVTRFLEQRVACFVFARRLHKISLFVVPKRGLMGGAGPTPVFGALPEPRFTSRGFSVVSWDKGEFAYLLVSDLNNAELVELGRRIQAAR